MKLGIQVVLVIALAGLLVGCQSPLIGKYQLEGSTQTMELAKDGQFFTSNGDSGEWTRDGDKIRLIHMVGSATGTIDGDTLVFPEVGSGNIVGDALEGTWVKAKQ